MPELQRLWRWELLVATVGGDPQIGSTRFTFGQIWLLDGIELLMLAVALFGVGEVLAITLLIIVVPLPVRVGQIRRSRSH